MYGDWIPQNRGKDNYLSYIRKWKDETLLILLNFEKKKKKVSLPGQDWRILLSGSWQGEYLRKKEWELGSYEVVILEKERE